MATATFQPSRKGVDFTQGSILSNIVRMAVPMTLAFVVNVLYSVVDRMYIGHIPGSGSLGLTGIGLAFPIITIVTAFQNLFGSGGAPLFSMANGRGDTDEAQKFLNNAAFMLVLTSVVLTIVGYAVKAKVLWYIGASTETFPYANDYLNIYLIGTIFVMVSMGVNPYINAEGYAKTGMFTVIIGAVVNIALDPLFIFVLGMGVRGAAIATVIAQFVSAVWVLVFITGKKAAIRLVVRGFRPDLSIIRRTVGLGLTEFCFSITTSVVSMILNARLQLLGGDSWVASMTIIHSVREIMFTIMHGISGASKPIISFNYGAKRNDRVKEGIRWLFILVFVYFVFAWAICMLIPGAIVKVFSDDTSLYDYAKISLRLYFALQFMMALHITGQNTFSALGKTKYALFFSLLRKVFLVIPFAYLLPNMFGLGVYGVFLAEPVADVVDGIACIVTMYLTIYRHL